MIRITDLALPLSHTEDELKQAVIQSLKIKASELVNFVVFKRSYDARKKVDIILIYTIDVEIKNELDHWPKISQLPRISQTPDTSYHFVAKASANQSARPVVVGFGPCGLFAAFILAEMGYRPIVLERGKTVRERTKDTWGLWRKRELNPESNVQFGEGGAGTFSDEIGRASCRERV